VSDEFVERRREVDRGVAGQLLAVEAREVDGLAALREPPPVAVELGPGGQGEKGGGKKDPAGAHRHGT
jgi:hypothetical protein